MLWYKNSKLIGIREKFGAKKQIITFGKGSGLSEMELRGWADNVLKRLDMGQPPDAVREWIHGSIGVL